MKPTEQNSDVLRTLGIEQRSGRRKWRWIFVVVMLVLLVFAGVAVVFWLNNGESVQEYKTEPVIRGNLTVTVTATGNLAPTNQVEVGSELSGTVRAVEADYNDHVTVGQVLARLDSTKIEASVRKSKASLASAQASLLQSRATVKETASELARLKNVRKLSDNRAVSQSSLDAAEAAHDRAVAAEAVAEAQVEVAEAGLNSDQTDLSKTVIHSPINGIVLARSIEPGQTVAASLSAPVLFTLAEDLTKMELHVDVDEADVGELEAQQRASFTVDAYPERVYQARVTQVRYGSQTTDGVVTYKAVLQVENPDLSLRPGMTATADIIVRDLKDKLLIPNKALRFVPTEASARESRNMFTWLLPGRQRKDAAEKKPDKSDANRLRVWTLEKRQPVPLMVSTGASDGTMTEVVDGAVKERMPLLVDVVSAKP